MSQQHFAFWPKNVPHAISAPATNVFYNAEVSARRWPDKPFIHWFGSDITFSQFHTDAEKLAGFLQNECNIARGDRVLLVAQNSPQFVIAYYAILRANAIVVPVSPMSLTRELEFYLSDSGARVAIVAQEVYSQLQPLVGTRVSHAIVATYSDYLTSTPDVHVPDVVAAARAPIAHGNVTHWTDALRAAHKPGPLTMGPDDICVIPYSSGTTGRPKGCVLLHRNVMHTLVTNVLWFASHADTRQLVVLPFFHVTSMQGGMNAPLYAGSTIVLMCRWDRALAAEMIQRHKVDTWTAISTMVIDFLANPDVEQYDLSSLRRISGGGAAMPAAIGERLQQIAGSPYVEGYGLTETIAPTHINPPQRPKRQCLGIPIFNTDSRVIDPDALRELPAREVGEIVTHGPQVFQGYWNNEEATQAAFIDLDGKRFFRTGDLGYVDEEGYFFLVDRLKRMINAAGFKVWPAEVEALMYQHPAVQEACVVAARDAHRGETVKAYVVLKPGLAEQVSAQDIIEWTRAQMAAYKHPRLVEFVDSLPKSATGKIAWRLLQEQERARSA